jgi:hypothetical protein
MKLHKYAEKKIGVNATLVTFALHTPISSKTHISLCHPFETSA